MSDLYFVLTNSWIWCDFCACADLLIQPMHAHLTLSPSSNMASSKENKSSKLLYTPVSIVREKELLLVNECTDRLGQFGLTLSVVSMNQMPKNCDLLNPISTWHAKQKKIFKYIYMLQFVDVHGRLEFVYDQEYHCCTPKNFYFYFIFCCCTPKNFFFISYFVVECPRISIYSASTPMSTMT